MASRIISLQNISLKNFPNIKEKDIQDYIANDPTVLGLGKVVLKGKEKNQPKAGRLDLLLEDSGKKLRYVVEIMLGKIDADHILRTIDYLERERKQNSDFDYCVVIIAEEFAGRLNKTLQSCKNHFPLIAIEMNAFKGGEKICIHFKKILDELKVDNDDDASIVSREFWETKSSKYTIELTDEILKIIKEIDSSVEIKYNKRYITFVRNGSPFKFVVMNAKNKFLEIGLKSDENGEIDKKINDSELDLIGYRKNIGRYFIRVKRDDIEKKKNILKWLLRKSYDYFKF